MGFDLATQVPVIFLGVLVGAFAFALLALALWPVVARKADANMAKGMLGVCVSFVILVLGSWWCACWRATRSFRSPQASSSGSSRDGSPSPFWSWRVRIEGSRGVRARLGKGGVLDAFAKLPGEITKLVSEFSSAAVAGDLNMGVTQYSFWLLVSSAVLLTIIFVFVKRQTLVPKGVFVNGVEYLIEYVENDVAKGVVGTDWRRHFPFLATIFFFILINNFIGLIPGMKPGTGAIGCTAALALVTFIYFVYFGCKKHGVIGYLKSLAPEGVAFPMNVFVWVIEVFSLLLRPITLAIRLFCNMFRRPHRHGLVLHHGGRLRPAPA